MRLRGFQLGGTDTFEAVRSHLRQCSQLGANVVRYQITHPSTYQPIDRFHYSKMTFDDYRIWWAFEVARIGEACDLIEKEKLGIKLIIDCHSPYGWKQKRLFGDEHLIFHSETHRHMWQNLWLDAVDHLRDFDAVLGYDLLNEPAVKSNKRWLRVAEKLAKKIRHLDKNKRIIISSRRGTPEQFRDMKPINVKGCWYTAHVYAPADISYYGIDRLDETKLYKFEEKLWLGWLEKQVRHVRNFQKQHKKRILIGEIGCSREVPDDIRHKFFDQWLMLFNRYRWHWCIHALGEAPVWEVRSTSAMFAIRGRM